MKKINLLKKIVISIFIVTLLWFLADTTLVVLALIFEKDVLQLGHFNYQNTPIALKLVALLKTIAFALFIYASYFLIKIVSLKNTTDYLNNTTSSLLSNAGKLIIVSHSISFLLSFSYFFMDIKYMVYFNADSRSLSLLMIVFGLFLMIFSNVMYTAKVIKQENDLTI